MLFNSLSYAIFLPIVFICYWVLPHKFRWLLTLVASYYFYMSWNPKYIVLILFTTVVSYSAARFLEISNKAKTRKFILFVTEISCLGVLFFFKYFNFVCDSVVSFFHIFSIPLSPITLKLILPVGISFYTFQTLSYVIDVYRGNVQAEHHFGDYAAFVSFFPQLVAGPIERTSSLLPQIKQRHDFNYQQATYGLKLMAWGFFKKITIADSLGTYVNSVYNSPQTYSGFSLVIATFFFALQIYCDFSGYSDIAIGTAKLLGINLTTNFNSPYFSQSIKEFWSRWHISLSTWFRDYVYIPLGGNRVSKPRKIFNLIITFLASGLWHGADWKYVIWGAVHGIMQSIESIFIKKGNLKNRGIIGFIRIIFIFGFVTFAWTFFAANSFSDALYIITHFFSGIAHPFSYILGGLNDIGLYDCDLAFVIISILILTFFDLWSLKHDVIASISKLKPFLRWGVYVCFILWIIWNIPCEKTTEFIYFQF